MHAVEITDPVVTGPSGGGGGSVQSLGGRPSDPGRDHASVDRFASKLRISTLLLVIIAVIKKSENANIRSEKLHANVV